MPRPPMVDEVEELLSEPSPLNLLQFASGLIEATRPTLDERIRGGEPAIETGELFHSFVDSGFPALIALARAGAALRPDDEVLAARLKRAERDRSEPTWLSGIGEITFAGARVHRHVLGDGENLLVGWSWPSGGAATIVAYVDHNMGTIVKDAFAVADSLDALDAAYREMSEPGFSIEPLDLADARARLAEALDGHDHTIGVPESDTWPVSRPLLAWIIERLPAGGAGWSRPEWSDADRQVLLDDFLASPLGHLDGLTPDEVAELTDPFLWFACDYGPGDPLRWSPVSVEIVLADWYPRKILGLPPALMRRVPDVLEGFVRFSHQRRAIPADLTTETVEAIGIWRHDFLAAVDRGGSPDAPGIGLSALLATDLDTLTDPDDEDAYMAAIVAGIEATVTDLVGGPTALADLDDEPLADVPFDWTGIPEPFRDLTADALVDLDRWATELFDTEVRTIARSVLAAVVTTDRATFTRTRDTAGLAAAILGFLNKRLTGRLSKREREQLPWRIHTLKALSEATGVAYSTLTSRSKTVANVIERSTIDWTPILHSTQRREALESRERIAEWRAAQTERS